MTKHLYIHIPFCKQFYAYCDFKQDLLEKYNSLLYIKNLIKNLKKYRNNKFETIYIGGGIPNCLPNIELKILLKELKKITNKNTEFTIECDPKFITDKQIEIFKENKINRISLNVQTTNNKILKETNRIHTIKEAQKAINLCYKNKIINVSIDFNYGYFNLTKTDIKNSIKFLLKNKIKHVSFYALEKMSNSVFEEKQLEIIIKYLKKTHFKRYEICNWAISKNYQSRHNLAYWLTKDWAAIGYGATGLENKVNYFWEKNLIDPKKISKKISKTNYYKQILMMGLRLTKGIDISKEPYKSAYLKFKNKLKFVTIKNNHLLCKNINLLNESIIDIF